MAVMFKELKFKVHTTQCDFKEYLRAYAALDFFQDLAWLHAEEIGVGYQDTLNHNLAWVVMYEQFEVVSRLPKFGETVIVKTWPKERGRLECLREYEICDENNNLMIKGISNWVLINIGKRTLSRGSEIKFNGEYLDKTNYPEKQKRKLDLNDEGIDYSYSYKVLLSDIDTNHHMNNSKYLDIIHNMQDMDSYKLWDKVEIAFIHEAKINDIINVKRFKDDNKDCYKGYVNDVACFEAIVYWKE